jgi:DNA-binding NarL/FixJ family response regulator
VRSTILAALSQREAAMWVERKRATAPPESPQSPSPARRGLSDVEKADILRLKGAGKSSRTIGLELGRSDRVVRRFLGKVAPPPPPHLRTDRPLLADEEREQILALHAAGRPRNAIAREIGRSPKSVGKVIREQSPRRRGRPPGSRSSTPEQRALAAKLQADGLPLSAIAMRVGMSVAAIGSHLRRRSPAAGKGGGGPFGPGNLGMPPSSARSVIRRERAKADRTP